MEDGDQLLEVIPAAVHHSIAHIQLMQSCDGAARIELNVGSLVNRATWSRLT